MGLARIGELGRTRLPGGVRRDTCPTEPFVKPPRPCTLRVTPFHIPPLWDSPRAEPQYVVVDATSARDVGHKVSPLEEAAHHLIVDVQ